MRAYSTKMDEAMALATSSFRDVFRKGTSVPYLTHLMSVAAMVGEGGGDDCVVILDETILVRSCACYSPF